MRSNAGKFFHETFHMHEEISCVFGLLRLWECEMESMST